MDAKTAARIEALTHQQGWDDLKATLEEMEERFWKRHRADIQAGKAFDQREIDRAMGKFDGIRVILRAPATAAAIMQRELDKQEVPE